ncbi:hypothetical protein [Empedobacter sp.]|uniref:hypothetical protein n=1 Tax=Empedobacter sp. TaxID=1927715 RepID=UPI00289B3FE3|nr:hypothetical protein [Empedobacter sp.]
MKLEIKDSKIELKTSVKDGHIEMLKIDIQGGQKEVTALFGVMTKQCPQLLEIFRDVLAVTEIQKTEKQMKDEFSSIFRDGGPAGFGRLMKELFEKVDAKRNGNN